MTEVPPLELALVVVAVFAAIPENSAVRLAIMLAVEVVAFAVVGFTATVTAFVVSTPETVTSTPVIRSSKVFGG